MTISITHSLFAEQCILLANLSNLTPYPLDNSIPTWYINYHTKDNTVSFTVIIDARSGVFGEVLDDGYISVGDPIRWLE
jgi:hypothetical protein